MSYLVFARKYRPQTFAQVVRQDHVTRTLANAIAANRVAHAILFSGPRGTGKTTVARILAKAMNCEQGPAAEPCNRCHSCLEITGGNAADVFEIDGASNNSVDQVRELRENLKYMPVRSRYKIYIIDEVHMLSLAAFNALLKTLEEPPEHVLFFFATTEIHKIPITILSRCQRHDLRRIDGEAIAGHMRKICDAENVTIDDESLLLIAREAGGSMRDSLSLLDHILACAQGPVTIDLISELLGIVDRKHLFDISEAVIRRDLQKVLAAIDTVWRQGYELKRFYADLVAHFHHLALAKLGPQAQGLIDLPAQETERMRTQVHEIPDSYLLQIFDLLFQAEPAVKFSSQPRLGLEMVFMKLFQTAPMLPIHTLIERLDQLQEQVRASGPSCAAAPGSADLRTVSETHAQHQLAATQKSTGLQGEKPDDERGRTRPVDAQQPIPRSAAQSNGIEGRIDIQALWQEILARVTETKPSLAGFLSKCRLQNDAEGRLVLEVTGNEFTLKNISKNIEMLEGLCQECSGRGMALKVVANFEDAEAKLEQKEKTSRLRQQAMSHPMVMAALELFDGRLIDIKVP